LCEVGVGPDWAGNASALGCKEMLGLASSGDSRWPTERSRYCSKVR